jgi:serine/threonine protein kinase
MPEDPDDPWIGQTLGSYEILRRIGQGGMGVVYLAKHQSLDRLDAIKFLPDQLAQDATYIELFFREAKAAAKLNHPNVVAVHDAGSINGVYYFVMDFVEGRDLGTILTEKGVLPMAEAVEYTRQAAGALGYAHSKGIVHRDVKPENLLLTPEGAIKVADLGLAKWSGEESSLMTQSGDILGSPVYIAPERLRDHQLIDPRTDIYSLGATIFHLLTGSIPYAGTSPVIMSKHLTDAVPDPRTINPEVDKDLSGIVMKMMAKEPADRHQTMEEVEEDLGDYLAGKGIGRSGASRARQKGKSFPAGKIAMAVSVILIAGVAGVFFLARSKKPAEAHDIPPPETKTAKSPDSFARDIPPPSQPQTASKPAGPGDILIHAFPSPDKNNPLLNASGCAVSSDNTVPYTIVSDPGGNGKEPSFVGYLQKQSVSSESYWYEVLPASCNNLSQFKMISFFMRVSPEKGASVPIILKSGTGAGAQSMVKAEDFVVGGGGLQSVWKRVDIPISAFKPGTGRANLSSVVQIQISERTNEGGSWHGTGWNCEVWIDDLTIVE